MTVRIKRTTRGVLPGVLALADSGLGESYLTASDFAKPGAVSWVAAESRRVVGFSLAEVLSSRELFSMYPKLRRVIARELRHGRLALFRSVVVDERHRGEGVGGKLMRAALQYLDKKHCKVLMLGWKRGRDVAIAGLAHRFAFKKRATIAALWSESSEKYGYTCPVCGPPPCRCWAVIYTLP
jgi:GNAT superfamily N-acetyltransferase